MTRDEIIRDIEERAYGAGAGQYMSLRCDVAREIVRLLKDQEPRVIELSEITPHVYVWVEDRNEKTLFPLKGGMVDPDGDDYFRFVENVNADYVYWPTVTYGKWWRVWNLMPSPEQMRDTPWVGESDAE